jgi:dihydroorotate dehydrogenase (NAD+) catalytic subunit
VIGNVQGGLSGPAIKPIALLKVHAGARGRAASTACPSSARAASPPRSDALEFIIAGASAVGVGTSLFYDPLVCKKINAGISDYLAAAGMTAVSELVGSMVTTKPAAKASLEPAVSC